MVREIQLSQGKVALVDNEDFERLNKFKWCAHQVKGKPFYAVRNVWIPAIKKCKMIHMHRELIAIPKGKITDHIDLNGLNNQKSNLRVATYRHNNQNTSRNVVTGTTWKSGKWQVQIMLEGRTRYLGRYSNREEAGTVYAVAEKCLVGD